MMKLNAKSPLTFGALARHWPEELPLIAFGGRGRHRIVPVAFSEVGYDDVKRVELAARERAGDPLPFRSGWIGVVSYDQFAPTLTPGAVPRIFRVERALVQDVLTNETHLTGDAGQHAAFELDAAVIDRLLGDDAPPERVPDFLLVAEAEAEDYLAKATEALAQIRAGRFYQINLLRYFRLAGEPSRAALAARLDATGGPHAAAFLVPGLDLWSFSPERFVQLRPTAAGLVAETRPIKGTAPRGATPDSDRQAAEALVSSPKDRAELHMIVDLMRNDLGQISRRGTVAVPSAGHLLSISNVHHLEAIVTSVLRHGLTLDELFRAVCPGGSVTGAPKREVMLAIREAEGRERGYFMGNAFYLDDSGRFDSSILIRTTARRAPRKDYEFAAGSGIVVQSDPAAERREIDAKSRVLTAPWS